jgi:hypothetical protein
MEKERNFLLEEKKKWGHARNKTEGGEEEVETHVL